MQGGLPEHVHGRKVGRANLAGTLLDRWLTPRSTWLFIRTGKSYADRLVARRRESQKRKREAAKKDDLAAAGRTSKPGRQSKPKAGKKGKAPARRRGTGCIK